MKKMLQKQGGIKESEYDKYLDGNVKNFDDTWKVARNNHTTEKGE